VFLPNGPVWVSPWTTSTFSASTPRRSATIWAKLVSEALAVRRGAGVDGHRPGGVDADLSGLEVAALHAPAVGAERPRRAEAADLDVGREADAAVDAAASELLLLAAKCVQVEHLQAAVERAVVVARVVDEAVRALVGELPDEVLAPQLEAIHAQLVGELVHGDLDEVRRLGPPGPADRVRAHLVREDADDVGLDGLEVVDAADDAGAERRDHRPSMRW
jgi:hypothetical protein